MKKAAKIEIRWSESRVISPNGEVFDGEDCWKQANRRLFSIASDAPPDMLGYHKTDVIITFDDGETYEARMDVKPIGKPDNDTNIGKHILDHLRFWAGERKPSHMNQETYESIIGDISKNSIQEIKRFLSEYYIPI